MKFFTSLAFACLAVASPLLETRAANGPGVVADFNKVSADTITLNQTINKLPKGGIGITALPVALQINNQATTVSNDLKQTITDVQNSQPYNSDDSFNIASVVINFIPTINDTVNNLIARKRDLQTASFQFGFVLVESQLKTLRNETATLGTALQAKLAEPYADFTPQVTGQILAIFDNAIKIYSTPF